MESNLKGVLKECFSAEGVLLDAIQTLALADYLTLLEKWNSNVRLTGPRNSEEIVRRLLPGTLDFLKIWEPSTGEIVLDVGAGAGIVGIPLGILFQKIRVSMVESSTRKSAFLSEAIREIGVGNFRVICDRVESLSEDRDNIGGFQAVFSRAVAPIGKLLPLVWPLLDREGALLVRQGENGDKELKEADPMLANHHAVVVKRLKVNGGAVIRLKRAD